MEHGYFDTDNVMKAGSYNLVVSGRGNGKTMKTDEIKRKLNSFYGQQEGRPVVSAKFVEVLQIDTEHQSYLIRDKQHIGIILKNGLVINGILVAKCSDIDLLIIDTGKFQANIYTDLIAKIL